VASAERMTDQRRGSIGTASLAQVRSILADLLDLP
jgi:hypothetical protein